MDYYQRAALGEVLVPDEITSTGEKQQKLVKFVSGQYNAYRGNYSGNIKIDEDGYGGYRIKNYGMSMNVTLNHFDFLGLLQNKVRYLVPNRDSPVQNAIEIYLG